MEKIISLWVELYVYETAKCNILFTFPGHIAVAGCLPCFNPCDSMDIGSYPRLYSAGVQMACGRNGGSRSRNPGFRVQQGCEKIFHGTVHRQGFGRHYHQGSHTWIGADCRYCDASAGLSISADNAFGLYPHIRRPVLQNK